MPSDPALYALALENNRLLKALTENWAKARATDTGKPMLVRDGVACGCIGSHTPACNSREESHCTVLDCVLPAGHRDPHCGKNGLELKVTRAPDAKQPDSSPDRLMLDEMQRMLSPSRRDGETPVAVLGRVLAHVFPFNPERAGGAAMALVESRIRDAALEEAAAKGDLYAERYDADAAYPEGRAHAKAGRAIAGAIRALKSKSAPLDLGLTPEEDDEIISSGGGFSHLSGQTTQAGPAPQPSDDPGELPKDCIEGRRTYQQCHEGLCSHLVVHDSGWALAQMRAGKKVVVPEWWAGKRRILWARIVNPNSRDERILDNLGELIHLTQDVYLSDKWQVVDA